MMTNRNKTVIYTGVTNNLRKRIQHHKDKEGSSFAKNITSQSLSIMNHSTVFMTQ